jgi:6-phosphogluconate dehydrogenase (decarboxylating)
MPTDRAIQIGMLGLARVGANLARRLMSGGHGFGASIYTPRR